MASQVMSKSKPAGSTKKKRPAPTTTAFHAESEDGSDHLVGIGNLRVMLFNDDGSWFAQGLEIDYFAQGSTLDDVKERFQRGLRATIDYHLRVYADISRILKVAPPEVWNEFYSKSAMFKRYYSQVSIHRGVSESLPFSGLAYYERADAA